MPSVEDIKAKPSKYLITATEFMEMVESVETEDQPNFSFNAKVFLIGFLKKGGQLSTSEQPSQSVMASGAEESMRVYMRSRAEDTTGESAPPCADVGDVGDVQDEHDEQDHSFSGVGEKRRTTADDGDPQCCNIMNVLKIVDQIATTHGGSGEYQGASASGRWLSDVYTMGRVKDSLSNLHNAIDRHPGPTPSQFDNVEKCVGQILNVHKQAISDIVGYVRPMRHLNV
jgi:hypothetical protein